MAVTFGARLAEAVMRTGAPAVVGIDPFLDRIGIAPGLSFEAAAAKVRSFCLTAVEAVAPIVPAVKPQSALFEALGAPGLAVLAEVVAVAKDAGLLVIVDGKRGDIGSTAEAYAKAQLDDDGPIGADAVTVSPYLGSESLAPYLRRLDAGKGVFVLLRTSNPGAGAWQRDTGLADAVSDYVAANGGPHTEAHGLSSLGVVVGATLPAEEVAGWRRRLPNTWFLVPGFGAQGAGPSDVAPHFRPDGLGALISSSRGVLFDGTNQVNRAGIAERAQAFVRALRRRGSD